MDPVKLRFFPQAELATRNGFPITPRKTAIVTIVEALIGATNKSPLDAGAQKELFQASAFVKARDASGS
jgi:hypothetical protein